MSLLATRPPKGRAPSRWALAGAGCGLLLALTLWAPAGWLASALAQASDGQLLLADAEGSVWQGSAVLVLAAGQGAQDAASLPGRLQWRLGLSGSGLALHLRQDCCINGELTVLARAGSDGPSLRLAPAQEGWTLRLPAALLGGLGTPWNTLQLGGTLRLSSREFGADRIQGRWQMKGQLDIDVLNLSSRVSTLATLGSYRLGISASPQQPGQAQLHLQTTEGALQMQGQGEAGATGRFRFRGEAQAAPGSETALNNLLNIIGRRQGARSVITIG